MKRHLISDADLHYAFDDVDLGTSGLAYDVTDDDLRWGLVGARGLDLLGGSGALLGDLSDGVADYDYGEKQVTQLKAYFEALGSPGASEPEGLAEWGREQHPVLEDMLPVLVRMTVTPTGLRTHEPANVIPPYADVICDVRALPGGPGADDHQIIFLHCQPPADSKQK